MHNSQIATWTRVSNKFRRLAKEHGLFCTSYSNRDRAGLTIMACSRQQPRIFDIGTRPSVLKAATKNTRDGGRARLATTVLKAATKNTREEGLAWRQQHAQGNNQEYPRWGKGSLGDNSMLNATKSIRDGDQANGLLKMRGEVT